VYETEDRQKACLSAAGFGDIPDLGFGPYTPPSIPTITIPSPGGGGTGGGGSAPRPTPWNTSGEERDKLLWSGDWAADACWLIDSYEPTIIGLGGDAKLPTGKIKLNNSTYKEITMERGYVVWPGSYYANYPGYMLSLVAKSGEKSCKTCAYETLSMCDDRVPIPPYSYMQPCPQPFLCGVSSSGMDMSTLWGRFLPCFRLAHPQC